MWQDDTKPIALHKYNEARDRFFDHFSNTPGVTHYGTFGSISAPGLSDLDLIVVVEDKVLNANLFSFPKLQGDEKYIFTHAPLVIPQSLQTLIPYYHLIKVKWHTAPLPSSDINHLHIIGSLHVLMKTFYLQSFLWGILFSKNRPCKRSILALTSVARSIQWLQHLSVSVTESDNLFVESILDFRKQWIKPPNSKIKYIEKLDSLLLKALKISIELPESLASHIIEFHSSHQFAAKQRGIQRNPLNFILEVPIRSADDIINKIQEEQYLYKAIQHSGKFRPVFFGNFAFSGPLAFSILRSELTIAKKYSNPIGNYAWGSMIDEDLEKVITKNLIAIIQKKYSVNLTFANAMSKARLYDSNFGGIWVPNGIQGFIFKYLAHTMGRIRIIRYYQSLIHNCSN